MNVTAATSSASNKHGFKKNSVVTAKDILAINFDLASNVTWSLFFKKATGTANIEKAAQVAVAVVALFVKDLAQKIYKLITRPLS